MNRTPARLTGLLSRWWLPLSLTTGLLGGLAYTLAGQVVYTSDAYVVVVAGGEATRAADYAAAYARVAAQPGVLGVSPADLSGVSVAASPDAPLIRLTAAASTAAEATGRADRLATALIAYAGAHSTDTHVRLAPFAGASSPSRPSAPVPLVNLAVGGCGAVLLGGLLRLAAPPARRRPVREPLPEPIGAGA
ncbi:hypothetical protein AB0C27_29095 [Nonomuraea sp. NPDC048882]|uniref:hypothetical protein n=1 Tax=Nonomuraea sp. NPDC048882 TaxID=3154347 RepID=UPI0033CAE982